MLAEFKIAPQNWIYGKELLGKELSKFIRAQIAAEVAAGKNKPGLAAVLVGNDPASEIYVSHKEKAAQEVGFLSRVIRLPTETSQTELLQLIDELNDDPAIHGILVQLPLPKHLEENVILQQIAPTKDADGFHYENIGRLSANNPQATVACTPLGIMLMLKLLPVDLTGMHAVVLGRSNIVGKPMAQLLLNEGQCTVTICHSKTKNLAEHIARADILVAAMGRRGVVDPSWLKAGAIVIDVGIHRTEKGLCGDLDFAAIKEKASYITPVPGGVGPMTIAMLLYNTLQNFKRGQYGR